MRIRLAGAVAVIAWMSVAASVAQAGTVTTIDFEGGTANTEIDDHYESLGVVFSNAKWIDVPPLSGGSPPMRLGGAGEGGTTPHNPTSANPIVIKFVGGATEVSILAMDVGRDGARMNAYDALGNLVDFDEGFGTGNGAGTNLTLSSSATPIAEIRLFQPNDTGTFDGLLWDDLKFTPLVPLPPAALLGLGLLGTLGALRARRRS